MYRSYKAGLALLLFDGPVPFLLGSRFMKMGQETYRPTEE